VRVPDAVTDVLRAAGIRFAYLFGSRATGANRPDSDADIAVMPIEPLGLLAESALSVDLARAFEVPSVDLVDLSRAPLALVGRILTDPILLLGHDQPDRIAFEVDTRARYFDFLPLLREHQQALLHRVAVEGLR
jgi:predicted nucleotidyltransferase